MTLRKKFFFIITGGAGAGKTMLLKELAKYKFKNVPENARGITKIF